MLVYVIGIILVVFGLYYWLNKNNDFWKKKGVAFVPPRLLIGNMGDMILNKRSIYQIVTDHYTNSKDLPYLGLFNMRQPILMVKDLNLVKNILVTEFNKFHDNTFNLNEKADPILAKNPFFLKGDRWKVARSQLSPFLTSAKVKAMFPLVQEVCKSMVKYIEREAEASGKNGFEVKELALKFTCDNVASCAFGLDECSFDNPNAEFRNMVEEFMKITPLVLLKFFVITVFPGLVKLIPVSTLDNNVADKFKKILIATVKYRKENNVKRNDFLDSIIELRSKSMPFEYTDDHMVAHAFTFFLDGSETSAVVFSFGVFELAVNLDVQNKLRTEIDQILDKYNDSVTFEAIQEMRYLDAVFNETLRKYPPTLMMTRNCTEDTKFSVSNKEITIEKDTHMYVPVYGIQHDPQHYPNPEVFDPERFTEDAEHPAPKNGFFGFGDGPRICLGQRFAQMQVKLGLVTIISNFEIRFNNKTKMPVQLDPTTFVLTAVGGLWVDFHKRERK